MKHLIACGLLLASFGARPVAAQTRRSVQGAQLWANLQGELALKNGDYLLLELHGENVTTYNGSTSFTPDRFLGFDQRATALTYEHFWSDHWSGGGALRYQANSSLRALAPELLLRHRSPLGPLTFGQRLSASRVYPLQSRPEPANFLSLRVDLEKILPLGSSNVALRPRLSYEAVTNVRLQKALDAANERTVQFTSLRAEVGCRVGDHFDFTPWFAYSTGYLLTLVQYNANGDPIGGGRLNLVTPVVGLDARFTLFEGKTAFERRQLPTQH